MSLVHVLILFFISRTVTSICVTESCPPGHFKTRQSCDNGSLSCEKCHNGYFMDRDNTEKRCMRCHTCPQNLGKQLSRSCTLYSDTECVCKPGYYTDDVNDERCLLCTASNRNCEREQCKNTEACTSATTSTTSTATTSTTTSTTTTTKMEIVTSLPVSPTDLQMDFHLNENKAGARVKPLLWVLLLILCVPLMYCVPVIVMRSFYKYRPLCPRRKDELDTEATPQTSTGRGRQQRPPALTLTISENTPMMDPMSAAPADSAAHSAPQRLGGELTALQEQPERFPAVVMYAVIKEVPLRRWKEFLRLLSVADQQLERAELDAGPSSVERQYQQLRMWSHKSSATMEDVYSALHHMELTSCAESIHESLERLHWRPPPETEEVYQRVTPAWDY